MFHLLNITVIVNTLTSLITTHPLTNRESDVISIQDASAPFRSLHSLGVCSYITVQNIMYLTFKGNSNVINFFVAFFCSSETQEC